MNTLEEQVKEVIEKIRPYIQHDGGDIVFVRLREDGMVFVKMLGACADCMSVHDTLSGGVEAILLEEVPGVIGVMLEDGMQELIDSME